MGRVQFFTLMMIMTDTDVLEAEVMKEEDQEAGTLVTTIEDFRGACMSQSLSTQPGVGLRFSPSPLALLLVLSHLVK